MVRAVRLARLARKAPISASIGITSSSQLQFSSSNAPSSKLKGAQRVVVMGPPGSGKGTYCRMLSPEIKAPHVSTGDLIRAEIRAGSALGREVEDRIAGGELLTDEMMADLLKSQLVNARGFLLDGFPRTPGQVELLEQIVTVEAALEFNQPDHIIVRKLLGRRICVECGRNYNVTAIYEGRHRFPPLLPVEEGICDSCGSGLLPRKDDTEDVIQRRLDTYRRLASSVRGAYIMRELLTEFEMYSGIEDMWPQLRALFGLPEEAPKAGKPPSS